MGNLGRSQKWVCGIVLSLGIVSAVLGFFAEAHRIKSYQIRIIDDQCIYPNSPALILGLIAALVLLVAQIIVNAAGGCICCTPGPPVPPNTAAASNRSIAVICLVACWITFLNAFALLMAGATLNNQRQEYMWFGGECNVVKPLVFAGGALLALATVILGLIFYLASSAAKARSTSAQVPPHHMSLGHPYATYPYGPTTGPPQTYVYPYSQPTFSSQTKEPVPANPKVPASHPVIGYPDVVTGYPEPRPPIGVM